MDICILGTGVVGNTFGTKLIDLGHHVMMGSRSSTNQKAADFVRNNGSRASHGTFSEAAEFGEIIFNCTKGDATFEVLNSIGTEHMNGKILIDLSNPLDFSKGFPPILSVSNTDSLGEQIQKAYPDVYVVKALN